MSWPVTILVLGGVFLLLFNNEIKQFLGNLVIRHRWPGGSETELSRRQQDQASGRLDLEAVTSDSTEDIATLKGQLEETRKYWLFENTYNLIYGSQIRLLEHLSRKASTGDSFQSLYSLFYDSSCRLYLVLRSYPFVNYMNFLETRNLVEKHGDNYKIAGLGIEFLNHIDVNSYFKNKPF